MQNFFQSRRFKVILTLLILLFAFLLRSLYTGETMSFLSEAGSLLLSPASKTAAGFSSLLEETFYPFLHAGAIMEENERLTEENRRLQEQLVDYQVLQNENNQLREYLEIKDEDQTLTFLPATVIARAPDSAFGSFTLDVGANDGVSPRDPVITVDGLVGVVTEVSGSYCNVQTILDVAVSVGALDIYTQDTGIITGSLPLSRQGLTRMNYLPRESSIAVGDVITTSGVSGLFPQGLKIGTIHSIEQSSSGLSVSAVVQPSADILSVKNVQIITGFSGKEISAG